MLLMLQTRRPHGQQALHEATACRALRAEATFAPQHRRPQRPFRRVVGWLHPWHRDKRPQPIPLLPQGRCQLARCLPLDAAPLLEAVPQRILHRLQRRLHCRPINRPFRILVPDRKHALHPAQCFTRPPACTPTLLCNRPQIALDRCPAHLPPLQRMRSVGCEPI